MREDNYESEEDIEARRAAHVLGYLIGSAQIVVAYCDNQSGKGMPIPAIFIESLRQAIKEAKS